MKYALVTGGSRGIGRAICVKLAQMGYSVIVNYVSNQTEAQNTIDLITEAGSTGEMLKFDVGNYEQTTAAIEAWQAAHPGEYVEVVVNNAGVSSDNLMVWLERDDWNRVIDTSLTGFYNTTKPLLQAMLRKKNGRIINMASVSGVNGIAGQCNYSAAKGGLIASTKALAMEIGRKGVTVNAIAPGFIKTDMVDGLDEDTLKKTIPLGRFGEASEVAALVGFLVSPEAAYITGECISISGGL